ncbi:Gfo/Idh/MocA family protein [Amycolatopsis cihanbeyliensis]|uniref:Putative dehydrogenase n=1 Tax=Amycolatopsis cihanbeyliensis TaxID=1128664 RepID=A0A542DDT8_AMYCI|nr:Gfo/Idh/MocA family oxidoreductase [Amycolatopsis cihanbeyliensis]TQJ01237.1 putative dehydrogenase [Amycolatopsis cihanbeyliensis]
MSERVALALAGLGDIGLSAHLPALLRNPDVQLTALVDPVPARRDLARLRASVPAYAELAEALEDRAIDGVVLATPPWVTPHLVERVARAGRFVLAEKPVATSAREAARLMNLSATLRKRVQVGLAYRHDPALELLREWIASRRLGAPLLVRAHVYDERRDAADPAHAARIESTLAHGMPVVHEGAHVLDWCRFLLGGEPERVEDAWALRTRPGLSGPNLCGARLAYSDGTVVLAEFGWLTGALPRCELDVLGDRGHVLLDGRTFRLRLDTVDGVEDVDFEPDRVTRCFDRQVRRFVDLITGEWPVPTPDLADGLAALELSERIAWLARESMG